MVPRASCGEENAIDRMYLVGAKVKISCPAVVSRWVSGSHLGEVTPKSPGKWGFGCNLPDFRCLRLKFQVRYYLRESDRGNCDGPFHFRVGDSLCLRGHIM